MAATQESDLDRLRRVRTLRERLARQRAPDEAAFLESCQIEDKVTGGLIFFRLWSAQVALLPELQHDRLLILKARQLGLTWLDLGHWLYEGTFWGHRLFLIARQTLDDAADGIHRLKVMHDSLPAEWRQPIVVDNTFSLGLANGSRYHAVTSTTRIAHGRAAYGGLLDEFALYENQGEVLAGAEPACERLHIVTTGQGGGDLTEAIWQAAGRGDGRWRRVFLPWTAHPERDAEWHALNVDQAPEPRRARREYAATPEDAFSSPQGVYFERLDPTRNTADLPVERHWTTWRLVDFGFRHPACLWMQRAPSGQLLIVDELLPDGTREPLTTPEFAAAILDRETTYNLDPPPRATYCDPAGRAASAQTGESEFEVFARAGLRPEGKTSSIRDGCVRIMDALADPVLPLVVASRCTGLITALSRVKPHRTQTECYDYDHVLYSHPLDALRYGLVNVTPGKGGIGSVVSGMHGERPAEF